MNVLVPKIGDCVKDMDKKYACWITVNRQCNLRCEWCYAKQSKYEQKSNLSADTFDDLLGIAKSMNVTHLTLVGGEPTLYKDLDYVITKSHKLSISCGIVSNGVRFASREYTSRLKKTGVDCIGLSLKGFSKDSFIYTTGKDHYTNCMNAIRNIQRIKIPFIVSMVLTPNNIDRFLFGVRDAINNGAEYFSFSFEFNFDNNSHYSMNECFKLFRLVYGFCKQYDELCALTNNQFSLHQTLPLCIWNMEFLLKMKEKQQLYTTCQLLQKNGLIFNTNGDLLVCNALYNYPIARYGVDFHDANDFKQTLESKSINSIYNKLCALPSNKCIDCSLWQQCGGGCVSNWCHYSLEELLYYYKVFKNSLDDNYYI